jgi:hypothetical protein
MQCTRKHTASEYVSEIAIGIMKQLKVKERRSEKKGLKKFPLNVNVKTFGQPGCFLFVFVININVITEKGRKAYIIIIIVICYRTQLFSIDTFEMILIGHHAF